MERFKIICTIGLIFFLSTTHAQVNNDECVFGTFLGNITDYCSGDAEFDNTQATASPEDIPFCWFGGSANDIWFTFTPTAPGVYISVDGQTMNTPSLAVYEGGCNALSEVDCASISNSNFVELSLSDMVIGQLYYLRIDARNLNVGSFQLCLTSFVPVPSPESDCKDAVVLCDKSPFQIDNLNSTGEVQNELTGSCVINSTQQNQSAEQASVWYTWTCDQSGTLTFTLTPNNPNSLEEDLDFVVYRLPGGLGDCDNRESVRCMLSGESGNLTPAQNAPCYGPTGLRVGETDTEEFAGCNDGSNNFVAPLDMVSGESYALIINNFSRSGFGFSIEFGGTGTFLGPEADFDFEAVQAFECDKTIVFTNLSSSDTDPIVGYTWNFGAGASPLSADDEGPHDVIYDSFGDKVAALTIESSRGCLVTKFVDIEVGACCQDTSTLFVQGTSTDLTCFGDTDGIILGEGFNGSPEYTYSIDGINFQPNPQFTNLTAGDYQLIIRDRKGCENEVPLDIIEPTQTTVSAGPNITVDLGESGQVLGEIFSDYDITNIEWSPLDSFITCTVCVDPEIIPPGNTAYTVTVTDENGCTASDEVQFLVNIVRPVFWPNIISANEDNINDFFNLSGGPAVDRIEVLQVYDRWGNLMYEGTPIINKPDEGWDGTFNDQFVNPGVYAWMAKVLFIDNETLTFAGDVTVVR